MADGQLSRNRTGDVVRRLKSAYHDGTTRIIMSPLEFMQRLAALVPRPRLHLIRFHGVLAPNAKLRSAIVPRPALNQPSLSADLAQAPGPTAPAPISSARLLKRVFQIDLEHCPNCGGALKMLVAIEDPTVMVAILTRLSLPAEPIAG
ncbi:MAG: transposase [Burkholderiales bacterium]